ncbi:DUF1232 domain-containing protein [Lacimicrobium sp. SS2-24]|uniref:YkvA family protein n=1 Tax=Lacimicrobium sp. SS2-24 TaxID=2005569 RepID=UPI000B4BD948|nr:DUF1232 domain-containing protein [Lacimicrobium sp. SS2-24]
MSISISFELTDSDLEHFRSALETASERAHQYSDQEILKKAGETCRQMEGAELPAFVSDRLKSLEMLMAAVQDEEWQMPEDERKSVLTSLAYFVDPQDMVPDNIPGLGYLDDAIMIELVIRDLSQDLSAYSEFCSYRETEEKRRGDAAKVDRESWLDGKRSQLRATLRKNRQSRMRKSVFSRIM